MKHSVYITHSFLPTTIVTGHPGFQRKELRLWEVNSPKWHSQCVEKARFEARPNPVFLITGFKSQNLILIILIQHLVSPGYVSILHIEPHLQLPIIYEVNTPSPLLNR
jgi:hypothetical protein